jgi:RHS repeat-associated protein
LTVSLRVANRLSVAFISINSTATKSSLSSVRVSSQPPRKSHALAATYTYDSFGNLISSTGAVTNSFRYTAREFDTETDLYYYRARYYDPLIGRFVSEDPIGFMGGGNFYAYAGDDPTIRWIRRGSIGSNIPANN